MAVTCQDVAAAGTAYFNVAVNAPPSSGTVTVSPPVVQLGSPVAVTATNWVDDTTVNLQYSFG